MRMEKASQFPPEKVWALSPGEWERLMEEFYYYGHSGPSSDYPLVEPVLACLLRKDFHLPLKIQLLLFLDDFSHSLFLNDHLLDRLLDTLRAVLLHSSHDALLKEQFLVSTTSILISLHDHPSTSTVRLVELLLTLINRPNHPSNRAIPCECLRQLETAYPSLLSHIVGHIWHLCHTDRTHSSHSYILLFSSLLHNIVSLHLNLPLFTTSVPLLPFTLAPSFLHSSSPSNTNINKEPHVLNHQDLRRALSFLLECPHLMTPCAMLEFISLILPVALALNLPPSMFTLQFFGMIHSYDSLLCHAVLIMLLQFSHSSQAQDPQLFLSLSHRLSSISIETHQYLVFRLLPLHWLLAFSRDVSKTTSLIKLCPAFYPKLFDPLALKAFKLDLLAFCSVSLHILPSQTTSHHTLHSLQLFQDALVSVSSFKCLPPGSAETAVMFRALHKFVISPSSHSDQHPSTTTYLLDTLIFPTLEGMLVNMMLDARRLVPFVVAFVDRLLSCKKHSLLGECLLQKFDEHLLPKVRMDYKLISYFPLFDRISENETIPPLRLLELLTNFMFFLLEKHGPNTFMKSWSHGSRVLGICRTMLIHQHSSRLFLRLSRMLAFTCLYYPDLEVRDNARIYLRMLICIPGKKLRNILNLGDLPSSQSSSFYSVQSPRLSQKFKTLRDLASCIYLERVTPLLVKQFWSLSLSSFGVSDSKPAYLGGIKDNETPEEENESAESPSMDIFPEMGRISQPQEPLRVIDSKTAEILNTLRKYFSCIPDFRYMPGLRVRVNCSLRLESSNFIRMLGIDTTIASPLEEIVAGPAIYATVLKFSSSAPYGSIPPYRIPFLLGEHYGNNASQNLSLSIVPVENGTRGKDKFSASVVIELEPREPTPGIVDVHLETNAENGQIIQGQLQGITVGIEDMFLKAIVPPDITEDAIPRYKLDLFHALWEACGTCSNTGRETFPLKGRKGVAAIYGTRSVKLLDVSMASLVQATERHLTSFVVGVIGEPLIDIVQGGGVIQNIIWDDTSDCSHDSTSVSNLGTAPLFLTYHDEDAMGGVSNVRRRNLGSILILIVLPPRFHLLFQMEVCDVSTLVQIRTDHWPSLAYVDDYLEALYLS